MRAFEFLRFGALINFLSRYFKFGLVARPAISFNIMSSILVFTFSGIFFENAIVPTTLSAHVICISFDISSFAGDVVWTYELPVFSILPQLLIELVIAVFTKTFRSIRHICVPTDVLKL